MTFGMDYHLIPNISKYIYNLVSQNQWTKAVNESKDQIIESKREGTNLLIYLNLKDFFVILIPLLTWQVDW